MAREDLIELEGTVVKKLNGGNYDVEVISETGQKLIVKAHMTGKIRMNNIRILVGDSVIVAVSPYDMTRGTIRWRDAR